MSEAAELAKLDGLPKAAKARARAILADARKWAGELRAVAVKPDPGGELHITITFEYGTFDFVTPAEQTPGEKGAKP